MQFPGFAIRRCGRHVRHACGTLHPQDNEVSREIMRQRRGSLDPALAVTRHEAHMILGHMPVGDDEAVGNHRSGRDHVRCLDADNPVSPHTYSLRGAACRSGHRKLAQAQDRKRQEMSFQGSHGVHLVLPCLQRQGHKPPRPNSQAIRRDIGLSSIWPASIWASCNVSSALMPA